MVVFALSLPFILRSIDYRALLIWQLESQLNRKVELGKASVEFFPHVRITLKGITVREPNSSTPFMSADRLFVDLRIFPLLARKIVVKRVLLDRPMLRITRGLDGKLNIADLFTSRQGAVTIPMLGEQTTIAEGRISFTERIHDYIGGKSAAPNDAGRHTDGARKRTLGSPKPKSRSARAFP